MRTKLLEFVENLEFVQATLGSRVVTLASMKFLWNLHRECCSFWRPHFELKDMSNNKILSIVGPCCVCDGPYCCCCENKFTLFGTDDTTEVGAIHKKYAGFLNEAFTGAEIFSIQFPLNMDAKMKAVAIGALFLIDFMYYVHVPQRGY
ncbi:unnamed protein product [Didymodactylos carnosus]|uniref:Phospholipid scramblase n=1 Tax=Didymodactylos carnosus TaxID=1234261 RepID=A0A8S2UMT7_9BILA|nr:unnamed protein product [Didymodactylos carnosus]CAF4353082.1 unnamed protein product [Didymodactylos carnosus]